MTEDLPDTVPTPAPTLRWLGLATVLLAAAMAVAMVLMSGFGRDAWMMPLVIAWNWVPLAGIWIVLDRTLTSRSAWAVGLAGLVAMAAMEAWFLFLTGQQFLIHAHGWRIEGVRQEALYGLASLIVPFYAGGAGLIGLVAAMAVELHARTRRAATGGETR
ncbi:hypothetical protein [Phreatobacter sp.]|uniref:hypothetical protein n=1 Tax=Phreatobacter sp. TaxID=1966341 RepID=UPI003F7285E6